MFRPDSSLLAGKVLKHSLPVLTPNGPQEANLKRLQLPQGELAQFYNGEEGMRYIAFIALQPGGLRGNHYHKTKQEWMYLIEGEVELLVEDVASQKRESVLLQTGDLTRIAPGVAHALRTIKAGQAVEFSPNCYERGDVYAHPLMP
jgi:mannose-6-phosphate isomerase-like protein (cupin superfamily)